MRSLENPILLIFLLIGFVFISKLSRAQVDEYDLLKSKYDWLSQEQKLDSALFVTREMNSWALRNEGDTSLKYAVSFRYMGNSFDELLFGDSALFYWDKSIAVLSNQSRLESLDAAHSYRNKGLFYEAKKDHSNAITNFKSSLDIYSNFYGEEDPELADICDKMGTLYYEIGDYKLAEPYYKQASEIYKKALGEGHADYARILMSLGILYFDMGDYQTPESYYKKAMSIYRKIFGEEHPEYAMGLNCLGDLNMQLGNYKTAERYYKKSIEIYKKVFGDENTDYAMSLKNLGTLYINMGDSKTAERYYKKSSEIFKKVLGEEHLDYVNSIHNLGSLYMDMGDYKTAERYYKQASGLYKKAFGEEHPEYASSLMCLEILYYFLGEYKAAEPFCKQASEIYKKALGEEDPDYAMSLNNLGTLYINMGDYKTAERYYKQALDIKKQALGEEHPDYAMTLNNLGTLYQSMCDYKAAEPYYLQSLIIFKKVFGNEHADYASSLNNLGILYYCMEDYKSAEQFQKESIEIKKKTIGENHPDYAISLISLGNLYSDMGDYKAAERYYKQALDIYKKVLGEGHPDYARNLMCLGTLYHEIGDYKLAELYYKKSLEIYKKYLGEHPDFANSTKNLGVLYCDMGNYQDAELYFNLCFQKKILQLKINFSWLSTKEKEAYWFNENDFYFDLNAFSSKASLDFPSITILSYNGYLISKSLLLETSLELDQAIAKSTDENLKVQFDEMRQLRVIYNQMQSEGSGKKELIDRYNAEADSIDKILVNQLGEYATAKRKFEITWKDVQTSLSLNDAAIEFASYYDEKDPTTKYIALVVRPDYEYPKLVKIGSEHEINEAIQMKDFSTLYSLVWQGIDSLLEGVGRVYYSPDGGLNNLSFSGLSRRENSSDSISYLIDRYELHQLTTTRYLADGTLKKQQPFEPSAVLLGGIDYNQIPTINVASKTEESNEDYLLHLNLDKEVQQSRSSSFSSKMPSLKGTEIEVKTISGLLNQNGWKATTYTGQSAGENQIKYDLLQKSPGILHIATHGFAFPDIVKKESDLIKMNEKSTYKASEDPMVRCGLMFSGANISWSGEPKKMIEQTGDDGILTAAEVANMDLSNTKLVVLSACETGLGKIEGSEGTFGLKRAFKLAGVEQLIVSLWSVPDKETMELMTLFYTDLTITKDPTVSFTKAQREMRYRYPTEPEKWAGFVLVR